LHIRKERGTRSEDLPTISGGMVRGLQKESSVRDATERPRASFDTRYPSKSSPIILPTRKNPLILFYF